MLNFVVDGTEVFTGDTLFKGSVGGVRAPGLDELRGPQALDHGRADEAPARDRRAPRPHRPDDDRRRVGEQRVRPRLARARRGVDRPLPVWDEDATLVLWAPDYDGGHKAWVRWADGRDDIVPGSQVVRA